MEVDDTTRTRLRTFGTATMSYDEILVTILDELERVRFVADVHRRADAKTNWVDLEDLE